MFIKYAPQYALTGQTYVPKAMAFDKDIPGISKWQPGEIKWIPDSMELKGKTLTSILLQNADFISIKKPGAN